MSDTTANISIGLNANNDIYIGSDGNLVMVTGITAVEQDCQHAMQAQFGEMFLQPLDGLPTLADVWQSQNFVKWEAVARSTLAGVPGVVRVVSFNLQPQGDTLVYATQILTTYSSTLLTVSGVLDQT